MNKPLIAINLIISLSLEIYGLYAIFNLSPYLLIGLLIAPFKVLYRENKSYILYIITLFFALQLPLLPLIEAKKIAKNNQDTYFLESRILKLQNDNEKLIKSGAWGIYKQNNLEIQDLKNELKLLNHDIIEVNYYKSFIEILIIFLVEYMLFFQLKNHKKNVKDVGIKNKFREIKI